MEEKSEKSEPPEATAKLIPLQILIPKKPENRHFYYNGFSNLIPRMYLKVHHDLDDCLKLWNQFSPKNSLFQLWDFRLAWYQGFGYKPFFYSLHLGNQVKAVLPLWFNETEKRYEWFGGTWPEDNLFFVTEDKYLPLLLKISPSPIHLNAIDKEKNNLIINNQSQFQFKDDYPKYILNIENLKTMDDYLLTLNKKSRHQLRYFYKKFNDYQSKLIILNGDQSQLLSKLKDLSIIDFERNDVSEYRKPQRMKTFEMIYKNQKEYQVLTFLVYIQNLLVSYDIIATYKNNFYILTGASDLLRFPGANSYITYLEIEYALKNKFQLIDCMQVDYNWKHKFFSSKPMLKFEK